MESSDITNSTTATDGAANGAGEFSGSTNDFTSTTPASGIRGKLDTARTKVVDGAHAATDWVKQADIDSIKSGIEEQVRTHPTRSLLVALGLGYVLGRAMRGNGV